MKFLHHLFSSNKHTGFDNIQGYDDIKNIVRRALESGDNYKLLFTAPPASGKTLFLLGATARPTGGHAQIAHDITSVVDHVTKLCHIYNG